MACGLIKKTKLQSKKDTSLARFFRIIVSESAHLIWRLRNTRVIDMRDPPDDTEIHNRWKETINRRITIDRLLTNKAKYGSKSLRKSLVLRTWAGTLDSEDDLPRDWTRSTGVLVGIG
ncbi:hypothetical protein C8F01DRAFT_1003308 [Mycena amicta]|nr:hypothetical protein C8F01DRAFT_1003308 [Mycena amicta]